MTGTDVDVVTGELVASGSVPDLSFAHSPEQTRKWMQSLQEYRRAILVNGPDFAVIPGTEKPSLLKPGAEKLLLAAGLGFTILKIDDDDSRTHQGVTYRCTVRRGALIVAECDGYAGYDESRFYTSQADAEAKERYNAEKWKRSVNVSKFVEYRAPWNSVIKMAQKRAMVGGVLNALAASGLFTQDLEDVADEATPAFDPAALLKPHLTGMTGEQTSALKAWRQANNLPAPSQMSPAEAARALVEIGRICAISDGQGLGVGIPPPTPAVDGPEVASPATSAPPATTPAPEPTANQRKQWAKDVHVAATHNKLSDVDLDLIILQVTNLRTESAGALTGPEVGTVINTIIKAAAEPEYLAQIRVAVGHAQADADIAAEKQRAVA